MRPYTKILQSNDPYQCNCVLWARHWVRSLPYGLFTLKQKKRVINSPDPHKGDVAIMDVGTLWGHVGIVTYVGKKHVTIVEANFKTCKFTERHATPANLRIVGYFHP